jgi:hypothetical protein
LEAAVRSLLGAVEDDQPALKAAARADAEAHFAVSTVVSQLIEIISGRARDTAAAPYGLAPHARNRAAARVDSDDVVARR